MVSVLDVVGPAHQVSKPRQFADFMVDGITCRTDGIRTDVFGNLWASSNAGANVGYSGVTVWNPAGQADRPHPPAGSVRQRRVRRPEAQPTLHGRRAVALCGVYEYAGIVTRIVGLVVWRAAETQHDAKNSDLAVLSAAVMCSPSVYAVRHRQRTVALVGARVIDGTGAAPIANATVLVSNGRIERIGPSASLKIPAGATRIDVAGKTIIPGLVNAHGHLGHGDSKLPVYDQIIQQLQLYPKFGVTTVYALGDDGVQSVRVSEENNKVPLTRARLFVSGARATAATAEEARKTIADRHALRVNIIKTGIGEGSNAPGADMRPEVYAALIDEAHKTEAACRGTPCQSGGRKGACERRARHHRAQHSRSGRRRGVHRRAEAPQRRLHSDAHARSVGVSVRIDARLHQRSVFPARHAALRARRSRASKIPRCTRRSRRIPARRCRSGSSIRRCATSSCCQTAA